MTKRMILMLVGVLVVFGGIFGFKAVGNYFMNDFFDNMPIPPVTITATEVREDRWIPSLEAVGSFVAVDGAELTVEVGGTVSQIHFENGQAVEAGQRLVSLDINVDEAELERLQAVARLAELEQARYERLFRQSSVSEADLQRAQSETAQATAAVRTQQARIRQKTVHAPADGIAGIRRVNPGQYVSPGMPVVTVESLDPIYLNFTLPEQRLARIQQGQRLTAHVDAFPNRHFEGTVSAIEPRIRESTRTFEVQATFSNEDNLLRPGMFARVRMETGSAETVTVIPQSAVQFNPYGNAVFVVGDSADELRVTQRLIRTGPARGDLIAVLEGVQVGERIASSGLLKLRNDAVVIIDDRASVQPTTEISPQPQNQ